MMKRVALSILLMATLLFMFGKAAHAQSNGVLQWTINGSTHKGFKVELFQVGAPYPSRQTITPSLNHSWTASWYNLVVTRNYFIRVTNLDNNVAQQTRAFTFVPNGGRGNPSYYAAVVDMTWGYPYLIDAYLYIYYV